MEAILKRITEKKRQLDSYQKLPAALVKNLYEWTRVDLTYSSNAIEGNTLSLQETALVVEKGITIAGKSINEHLEAINLAQAVDFIATLAKEKTRQEITLEDILSIHRMVLNKIDDQNAGKLRTVAIRITGSMVPHPNYLKVPELLTDFMTWLHDGTQHSAKIAADAHLKFVFIHPFVDGNGRTARLLLNLLLSQQGYPLVSIDQKERLTYINAIEKALRDNQPDDYYHVIFSAIEHSLDLYLNAIAESSLT